MRKLFILIFSFLLLISFTYAYQSNYSQMGSKDRSFQQEAVGRFNTGTLETRDYYRGLDGGQFWTTVYDLDGDGVREIVVLDSGSLKLYNEITLEGLDSYTFSNIYKTPPVLLDYDKDGDVEIIIGSYSYSAATNDNHIYILNYDGVNINLETNITDGVTNTNAVDEMVLGCDPDTLKCVSITRSASVFDVFAFNSSNNKSTPDLITAASYSCFSAYKNIPVGDFDNSRDGFIETAFSNYRITGASEQADVYLIDIGVNMTATLKNSYSDSITSWIGAVAGACDQGNQGFYITNVLAHDLDGISNTKELAVGYLTGSNQFAIKTFSSSLTGVQHHPKRSFLPLNAEGEYLSNIFVADQSSVNSDYDVCVIGFTNSTDQNQLDVLCAYNSGTFESGTEFITNISQNLSMGAFKTPLYAHSVETSDFQHTGSPQGVNLNYNRDEILTGVGVLAFNYDGYICPTAPCELNLLWDNAYTRSALVPIDYEKINRFDIIALSSSQLVYIDDGTSQQDCSQQGDEGETTCIYSVVFNPCNDVAIKQNTTIGLSITTAESDGDSVSVRAIYDYGTPYNITTNWTAYKSAGFTHSISFTNTSRLVPSGTIRIEARENGKNENNTGYQDYPFTIANEGVEYGETTCEYVTEAVTEADEIPDEAVIDLQENALQQLLDETTGRAGFGRTAGWIFVMILLGVFVITQMRGNSSSQFFTMVGVLAFIEFLMVILGVLFGFIGLGHLIAVVVVMFVIGGILIYKLSTGAGN